MTKIAPIRTSNSNNALWFNANSLKLKIGDKVVVETARGIEFGEVAQKVFVASKNQLDSLKSPLKPVLRIATNKDIDRSRIMSKKAKDAMNPFKNLAQKHNPQMVPVSVEYLLDGQKAIFYFNAPQRQDFRELVRSLSNKLHIRVDMHQINEREKSALVGGIGGCGQEICCKRCGRFPKHTSIKMAKAQGLALNPENISGCCGKLLCCLAYEFDQYDEFNKRAPKMKGKVDTPEGTAVVCDLSMPTETIQLKYGDPEKRVRVPLKYIKKDKRLAQPGQNIRPNKIEKPDWEKALQLSNEEHLDKLYTTQVLTQEEKLFDGKVRVMPTATPQKKTLQSSDTIKQKNKKKRRRSKRTNSKRNNQASQQGFVVADGTRRRRRSRTITSSSSNSANRPGRNSSAVKRARNGK